MFWTEEEYEAYCKKRQAEKQQTKCRANVSQSTTTLPMPIAEADTSHSDTVISYTIPLPPVTKKNHGQIIYIGEKCPKCSKGQKAVMLPSKPYKQYEKAIKPYLKEMLAKIGNTIDYPVNLQCKFYQKERRRADLVGHLQAIQDLMTTYEVISDDNRNIIASTNGSEVLYDKANPRTEITITPKQNYEQWTSEKTRKRGE